MEQEGTGKEQGCHSLTLSHCTWQQLWANALVKCKINCLEKYKKQNQRTLFQAVFCFRPAVKINYKLFVVAAGKAGKAAAAAAAAVSIN